jgi:hypothetical protein
MLIGLVVGLQRRSRQIREAICLRASPAVVPVALLLNLQSSLPLPFHPITPPKFSDERRPSALATNFPGIDQREEEIGELYLVRKFFVKNPTS